MKTKYLKYFLAIAALQITFSCKDYLVVNPVTSYGPDYVFANVERATQAVIGAYSPLGGDNGYGIRISMYYPYDNDEMMGQGGTPFPDGERRDIAHGNLTPDNTQLATPFNQLYSGVERANICIYYIPKMSQYSSGSADDQTTLKRLHGEALTLRAQYYFELIRNWGDVPAQFQPSSFETNLFKPRENRDVIYDQLLKDLEQAEGLVPWRSQVAADERITQGAVRALRARIALARGGYSLRNDNGNWSMQRGSGNYKDFYQIAKDECKAIMQSGEHSLNPSYQAVFKDAICAHALEPNGEIIFQIGMTGGTSATGDSKLGYYNGPKVGMTNGSGGVGNAALTILPTQFYSFDANDTRRDVTCAAYGVNLDGSLVPTTMQTIVDGKFRRDWITNPVPSPTSAQQYFGLSWPLIRYSDVLLMFAEADNELNGAPSGEAIVAYEQVRKRAFGVNPIGTTPADYAGFFNAIVNERSFELCAEGIRKYDLLRWNMLTQKLQDTKSKLLAMALGQAPYDQLPATMYYYPSTSATGVKWANSLTQPAPATAPAGAVTTGVSWAAKGNGTATPSWYVNTIYPYYAYYFTPNKNELLPIATSVLSTNSNLTQNNF